MWRRGSVVIDKTFVIMALACAMAPIVGGGVFPVVFPLFVQRAGCEAGGGSTREPLLQRNILYRAKVIPNLRISSVRLPATTSDPLEMPASHVAAHLSCPSDLLTRGGARATG